MNGTMYRPGGRSVSHRLESPQPLFFPEAGGERETRRRSGVPPGSAHAGQAAAPSCVTGEWLPGGDHTWWEREGAGPTPALPANRAEEKSHPITEALQAPGGGAISGIRCTIGRWAGAVQDLRCGPGRSSSPGPSRGGDGGGSCGGGDGPRADDGRGRRVLGALVPQRVAAPRQPRAASGRARGAVCALCLHPRPVVRGLLICGHQPMEVRGPYTAGWGGNTQRTPAISDTVVSPRVAPSEFHDGLGNRGHDPSVLTKLSSETRSRPAASS